LIGKAAGVYENLENISFGAFLTLLRPNQKVITKFFSYFYHTDFYRKSIRDLSGGVNINNIKKDHLAQIDFPLPPLPEQQRIVAKLDALFGHLDSLREKLDRIPGLLKNFRQQVLTQAVTGELTKEWREGKGLGEWEETLLIFFREREKEFELSKKTDGRKRRKPEYLNYSVSELKPSSVNGWCTGPIGLICDSIVPGRDKPKSFTGEIPWVTMPVLKADTIGKEDAELFLTEEEIIEVKAKIIPSESVVMSIVGRFGIGSILNCEAVINQQLHAFLPSKILLPKFLLYQVNTSEKYLNDISTSTTVAYINKTNANSLPVALPPIEEQKEIINRVDALFELTDKIESQYRSLKAKIEQLPQGILAKAFRGELVEQEAVKGYQLEDGEGLMAADPGEADYSDNKSM
jgi:type I restriction enzyme S subunit